MGAKVEKYSDQLKLKAKEMFLTGGYSLEDIAVKVRELSGRKANSALINHWVNRYGWKKEKEALFQRAGSEITRSITEAVLTRTTEQLSAYQDMVAMGLEAIKEKNVAVDKVGEAVELIDKGIRGERMISSGLVSWKYIEQVVQVITEEVKDDETKRRIASRLRRVTEDILSL